jgi:hypothetical protein
METHSRTSWFEGYHQLAKACSISKMDGISGAIFWPFEGVFRYFGVTLVPHFGEHHYMLWVSKACFLEIFTPNMLKTRQM